MSKSANVLSTILFGIWILSSCSSLKTQVSSPLSKQAEGLELGSMVTIKETVRVPSRISYDIRPLEIYERAPSVGKEYVSCSSSEKIVEYGDGTVRKQGFLIAGEDNEIIEKFIEDRTKFEVTEIKDHKIKISYRPARSDRREHFEIVCKVMNYIDGDEVFVRPANNIDMLAIFENLGSASLSPH